MLDNWGVRRLAEYERHESIDEMKHADRLAERILFLEGLPNLQKLGRLRIGETVEEILKADLELEREAIGQLKGAVATPRPSATMSAANCSSPSWRARRAMSTSSKPSSS